MVMFFVVTPVPFTHTLCVLVLGACTLVRRFTGEAGVFIHSRTYQSGRAFYLRSHSKFESEFPSLCHRFHAGKNS